MMVANMSVLENSSFFATDQFFQLIGKLVNMLGSELIYGEIFEKNLKNNIFLDFKVGR